MKRQILVLGQCQKLARCQNVVRNFSQSHYLIPSLRACSKVNNLNLWTPPNKFILHKRHLSSVVTSSNEDVLLPGNIFRSHLSNITIPEVPLHELLFKEFEAYKDAPALSEFVVAKSYTYQDVKNNSIKVASALTRLGFKKGDIILIFSSNTVDYTILMIAASCIGAIVSAANPTFTEDELLRQVNHSECSAIFTIPDLALTCKKVVDSKNMKRKLKGLYVFGEAEGFQPFQSLLEDDGQALPNVSIDVKEDLFVLPYSSGTTGLPKGVMLTHHNIVSNVLQTITSSKVRFGQNALCLLPLYHIYGMVIIQFGMLIKGGHLHYLPKFEPETFLKCLQERKISMAHLVPPLVLFLAKHPDVAKFDLTHLEQIFCGAAPLGKELTSEVEERFKEKLFVVQGYGLTETSPVTNIDTGRNPGSIGNLVCNTLGKIVDLTSGEALGPYQEGEFCVKGPQVMKGYLKNQAATEDMVTSDGWLHTGDIGYYNEKGLVYISDRLKELIKYKGSQVPPAELEAHLLGHEYVQDVAVIGIPDEVGNELPRAYVVKKPQSDVTEADLVKYIEERVSPVKRLRGGVRFVDSIPKTPSGKILRRILKTWS